MRKRFWAAFTVVTMLAATIFEAAVIPVMGYDDLSSITPAGIIGYTDDADDISTNDTGTDDIVADVIGEDEPGQQESDLETGSVEPVEFDHVDETPDEPELNKSGTDITPYITIDKNNYITKYTGTDIADIIIPDGIVGIDRTVFRNHKEIVSVSFPDSLKEIGGSAFEGASFGTKNSYGSLTIPSGVDKIGDSAFSGCQYLETVTFIDASGTPEPIVFVESLGDGNTFKSCPVLKAITLSNRTTKLPATFASNNKLLEEVIWPANLTFIGANAFKGDTQLVSSDFSNTKLVTIDHGAFNGCSSLPAAKFPSTLTTIEFNAFAGSAMGLNTAVGNLVIPSGVTKLGYSAFEECSLLGTVTFDDASGMSPESISLTESLGDGKQFFKCPHLKSIRLSNRFTSLSTFFAARNAELESVTWPKELTTIKASAFLNDVELTTSDLSETNVTSIGQNAFSGCKKLPLVKFPEDTLLTIEGGAFSETSMKDGSKPGNLMIPSSVDTLGYSAFYKCSDLGSVTFSDYTGNGKPNAISFTESLGDGDQFAKCPVLKQIKLSNKVVTLSHTFASDNPELTTVVWPAGLTKINFGAFKNDPKLVSSDLSGTKLTLIEGNAFLDCTTLPAVKFPKDTLEQIDTGAFKNTSSKGDLTIPASILKIGNEVFEYTKDLETVTFEQDNGYVNPMTLGEHLFTRSDKLVSIIVSNRIKKIPGYFAMHCPSLSYITIPDKVTEVGYHAFYLDKQSDGKLKETVLTSSNEVALNYDWTESNRKLVAKLSGGGGGKKPVQEEDYTPEAIVLNGVCFDRTNIVLSADESTVVIAEALPSGVSDVTWSVTYDTDPAGVRVADCIESLDSAGNKVLSIKAVNPGSINITAKATTKDGAFSAECMVTVTGSANDVSNNSNDTAERTDKESKAPGSTKGIWVAGLDPNGYGYTGAPVIPSVRVYYDKTLLRPGIDYVIACKNNKVVTDDAELIVFGKGSYSNKHTEKFKINKCDLSNVNGLVSASAVKTARGTNVVVTVLGKAIKKDRDYTVTENPDSTLTVTGTGSYTGSRKIGVTETAPVDVRKLKISMPVIKEYTGEAIVLGDELSLSDKNGVIASDNFKVVYENNTNIGVASVYITGVTAADGTGFTGTIRKAFKIMPVKLSAANTTVRVPQTAVYTKGGARVSPVIEWKSTGGKSWTLIEGIDYTLVFKNNAAAGKNASVTVKGIGNFKGSLLGPYEYTVTKANIGKLYGFAQDVAYSAKKAGKAYMSVPVIYDTDGKLLAQKKDYTVAYVNVTRGKYIGNSSTANAGDELRVIVKGINSYEGSTLNIDYRVVDNLKSIVKAGVAKIAPLEYTGTELELDPFPVVSIGKTPVEMGNDGFSVVRYFNNVNKGIAYVLIKGTGSYSGYRLIAFKIIPQKWQ